VNLRRQEFALKETVYHVAETYSVARLLVPAILAVTNTDAAIIPQALSARRRKTCSAQVEDNEPHWSTRWSTSPSLLSKGLGRFVGTLGSLSLISLPLYLPG
jgi:hypothetical protein